MVTLIEILEGNLCHEIRINIKWQKRITLKLY